MRVKPEKESTRNHRWDLPGNFRDFMRVMVFYLFCQRSMRIIVTVDFCHLVYIYTFIHDIYIGETSDNNVLKLTCHTYIHIETSIKLYITVIHFHGELCF